MKIYDPERLESSVVTEVSSAIVYGGSSLDYSQIGSYCFHPQCFA